MNGAARTPVHLWIVGVLAAAWNAVGALDYVMTQTRNAAWLANLSERLLEYFESLPAWMEAAWACGVWGGLAGSLLLLARSRYAVWAFGVSLAGLLVATIYKFAVSNPPPEVVTPAMLLTNLMIWVIAIALLLYARRMHSRGVLR